MRRRMIELVVCVAVLTVVQSGVAFADAGSHGSCIGIEASTISPKGTSDEFPGGVPDLTRVVRSLGVTPGTVFGAVARLHEGSHEACDAATE